MILEYQHYEEIAHIKYKYRCIEEFTTQTRVKGFDVATKYIHLRSNGLLTIKKNYACDGCSGPTMDDKSNMQGGFIHDALYQLLRLGLLGIGKKKFNKVRKLVDMTFRDQLKTDGMGFIRRNYYYQGVRLGGKKHALPRGEL